MTYQTKIKIGRYGAIVAIPVVLCIPILLTELMCLLLSEVSWSRIMEEPEWRDFTATFIIGSSLFHLPVCVILYFFARQLKENRIKHALLRYCALLVGFMLSTFYYFLLYRSSNVYWIKFIPGSIYLVLLIPPLSLGLSGILRWKNPINTH